MGEETNGVSSEIMIDARKMRTTSGVFYIAEGVIDKREGIFLPAARTIPLTSADYSRLPHNAYPLVDSPGYELSGVMRYEGAILV